MKWIFACVLAVGLLTGCTSGATPTPANGASQGGEDESKRSGDMLQKELEQRDAEQNKGKKQQQTEPAPPKVVYESVFDIPLESIESDRVYTQRSKITNIEALNQEDPGNSIIAGMQLAYNLYMTNAAENGIKGLGLAQTDTRVFRYISDNEKQLVTLADLKVGQEIEVQYISPLTPLSLAIEITILNES